MGQNQMRIKNLITRLQKAVDAGLTHVVIKDDRIKVIYPDDHIQDLAPILSKERLRLPPKPSDPMYAPDEPVHSQDHWHDIYEQKEKIKEQFKRFL
jgi:hypothetical protein